MKVLTLCLSPNKGGLEMYACKMVEAFRSKNIDCLTVTGENSYIKKALKTKGVANLSVKPLFPFFPIISALRLARWIRLKDVDIIHIHWNKDLRLAVLAKIFSRKKVSVVYSRHMGITRNKKDIYHRFLYKRVSYLITHTKLMQQEAIDRLPIPPERIKMIYLGVPEPNKIDDNAADNFLHDTGLDKVDFKIGLFGRIEYGKGQHLLVESLSNLKQAGCNAGAGFVGHVMDEKYLAGLKQSIKSYGLEKQTHFFGFVDEPVCYMRCFDVIVLTTYCETFGLVLIEAMRAGVPVIGANAGGVPEIIAHRDTGLLFESGNADSLTEILIELSSDPELKKQLAEAGRIMADKKFSEAQHVKALMEVIL